MTSRTIAARVPEAFAAEVEARAAAAGLTTSDYIARVLRGRQTESYPVLVALAAVLQIASIVERTGDCDPKMLDALRGHIAVLVSSVRAETA